MAITWIYGVILVVIGSIGNNLGNNLVSLGHKEYHEQDASKCTNDLSMNTEVSDPGHPSGKHANEPFCSWCMVGRVVFVLGSLFTFASFGFGAQSLIASLESIQFVSNVVFVHYVHHEPVTRRMLMATLSIVLGNVLVVIFAEHEAKTYTSDDMIRLYKTNYIYHGYMVFAFFLWLLTTYIYNKYYNSRMKDRILLWHHSFMEPFCYSVSSAIIGTQAVLNSKCLALLIESTTSGTKNEFAFWYLYFILGTWLLLVAYWLARLDGGLALFPPMFIIPVMQVFFVFFAIVCGGIYFQEFVHFNWSQYVGFICGVTLILSGVYGLAPLDMKLYVPGDPKAPAPVKVKLCDGSVFCEDALPPDMKEDLEKGRDPQLDKLMDSAVSIKPTPDGHPDINLFSATVAIEPNEPDLNVPVFDANATAASARAAASKKNRKVVKRPPADAGHIQLPPLQVRGAGTGAAGGVPPGEARRDSNSEAPAGPISPAASEGTLGSPVVA